MAYKVIEKKVRKLGFCCEFSYFIAVKNTPTLEVSVELEVHRRTARRWRQQMREGVRTCPHASNCLNHCPLQTECLSLDHAPDE